MNYEVVGRTVIGTYATIVKADSPNEAIKKGYRKLAPRAGSYLLKQTWIADSWEATCKKTCFCGKSSGGDICDNCGQCACEWCDEKICPED